MGGGIFFTPAGGVERVAHFKSMVVSLPHVHAYVELCVGRWDELVRPDAGPMGGWFASTELNRESEGEQRGAHGPASNERVDVTDADGSR